MTCQGQWVFSWDCWVRASQLLVFATAWRSSRVHLAFGKYVCRGEA
ncbi:MAG: hypothetical protein JGK01_00645 [Microcoleus sp. PH2017_03_ELD_O_A]|nr:MULTISPECIES: hypothetical protein [unclassified Microcoleus]MCC3440337.1 hypothetical protein [Microcoleus sp. PH2017_03_ELD_O_A]MCC3510533.1 hypothetical protein [Microcoleus sp. PH2017_17_BER_D_A]